MRKFQGSLMRCQRVFVSASWGNFQNKLRQARGDLNDSTHAGHHFPGYWVSFPREIEDILE